MAGKLFTLTTDFGLKDPYVAEMKAVILSLCPDATVVDVSNSVEKFNVRMGAYVLACAAPYFPEGTIHVAVVDPGVGTGRRAIIVQTERSFFLAPDNGVVALAAEAEGIKFVHEITSRRLMLTHVSGTFHGRDILAPVAAHLANGVSLDEFGPEILDIVKPPFAEVKRENEVLVGEVLHVDDFGNIITNIRSSEVVHMRGDVIHVKLPQAKLELKLVSAYANVKPHEPLTLIGSHNYLEIALDQGNAAEKFQVRAGDRVTVSHSLA